MLRLTGKQLPNPESARRRQSEFFGRQRVDKARRHPLRRAGTIDAEAPDHFFLTAPAPPVLFSNGDTGAVTVLTCFGFLISLLLRF
jgi:hypothetical protein